MNRSLAFLPLVMILTLGSAHAETALELAARCDDEKIAALNGYLAANPEADDRDAALRILVATSFDQGLFESIPDLLEQRFAIQSRFEKANHALILDEIVRPYIEVAIVSDQRDRAKAFVTKVREFHSERGDSDRLVSLLDQFAADLYLPGVGDKMDFAFTDLDGREVDLGEMEGDVVLIDFWATWSDPCVAEVPSRISLHEQFKDAGFQIVGVSLDRNQASLERFLAEHGIPWPHYFDGKEFDNEIAQRFGIKRLPASFLVGKEGRIIAANLRGEELEGAIQKVIE